MNSHRETKGSVAPSSAGSFSISQSSASTIFSSSASLERSFYHILLKYIILILFYIIKYIILYYCMSFIVLCSIRLYLYISLLPLCDFWSSLPIGSQELQPASFHTTSISFWQDHLPQGTLRPCEALRSFAKLSIPHFGAVRIENSSQKASKRLQKGFQKASYFNISNPFSKF